jgi:hypothetical protein
MGVNHYSGSVELVFCKAHLGYYPQNYFLLGFGSGDLFWWSKATIDWFRRRRCILVGSHQPIDEAIPNLLFIGRLLHFLGSYVLVRESIRIAHAQCSTLIIFSSHARRVRVCLTSARGWVQADGILKCRGS